MANFTTPFAGNVDRKISNGELAQAIRIDIAAELEAIFLYDAHIHATDDLFAKEVLRDIRDEEKVHVGQLLRLVDYLEPEGVEFFLEGNQEAEELLDELKEKGRRAKSETIGSLRSKRGE